MNASLTSVNATTPSPSTGESSDPWVESGAMVYVAITVATVSAIIMCCTWFITHHPFVAKWLKHEVVYNSVESDDEEEIQLTAPRCESPYDLESSTKTESVSNSNVFTLEASDDSEEEEEAEEEEESEQVEEETLARPAV